MKIIGLGNALVDVLIQLTDNRVIEQLKLPKGSMQLIQASDIPEINNHIRDLPAIMASGGSAANTIHGLARTGTQCGYVGKVGRDEFGEFYNNDLKSAGVISTLYRSLTATGRAYTFITPDSERTFATYLGAAIELTQDDITVHHFKGYDLLHIEGYLVQNTSLVKNILIIAKECGLKVSLDLASYNVVEANLKFLSEIIPAYVDILFANEEEARAYTGMSPESALNKIAAQCEIAIVKVGKEGSLIKKGDKFFKVGAVSAKVLDTTGAGDQYAAGFLHGLSRDLDLEQCGKLGSLLAGKVIENYGARIPDALWPEIMLQAEKIIYK